MLYGTVKKIRAGEDAGFTEMYTEYIEVIDEAAALSEFIKFIRQIQTKGYQEPCMKFVLKDGGAIKRVITEYSLPVDE